MRCILSAVLLILLAGAGRAQEFKAITIKEDDPKKAKGVRITSIHKDGLEKELGLKPGDTILTINGQAVNSDRELAEAFRKLRIHKPSEKLEKPTTNLVLLRDSSNSSNQVTISGWLIRSAFADPRTGKVQYYFRPYAKPKFSAPKRAG